MIEITAWLSYSNNTNSEFKKEHDGQMYHKRMLNECINEQCINESREERNLIVIPGAET